MMCGAMTADANAPEPNTASMCSESRSAPVSTGVTIWSCGRATSAMARQTSRARDASARPARSRAAAANSARFTAAPSATSAGNAQPGQPTGRHGGECPRKTSGELSPQLSTGHSLCCWQWLQGEAQGTVRRCIRGASPTLLRFWAISVQCVHVLVNRIEQRIADVQRQAGAGGAGVREGSVKTPAGDQLSHHLIPDRAVVLVRGPVRGVFRLPARTGGVQGVQVEVLVGPGEILNGLNVSPFVAGQVDTHLCSLSGMGEARR